jgi:ABC-2 type transport system permease protein
MSPLLREAGFMLRDRGALLWIVLAFLLSAAATGFGIAEVRDQRATIAALLEEDAKDRAEALANESDWGGAAYGAFHLTYAPPSRLAFAALGQRDTAPWLHRVRMLALEGHQIPQPEPVERGTWHRSEQGCSGVALALTSHQT